MKTVLVCLLLAYCSFDVSCLSNNLVDDTKIIDELRATARSVIKDLSQYKIKYQYQAKLNLKDVQDDSLNKMSGIVRYVTNSIKNAVNAVSSTGKNADSCLQACKVSLKDLNQSTNKELDKCYDTFSLYIEPTMKDIKSTMQNVENISGDLDYITIGCTKHLSSTEDCLTEKLEEVGKTLRNMQVYVAGIKSTGSSAMNKAKTVVTSCSEKAVRAMHVEATFNIQREANICVRNIYQKDH